MHNDLIEIKKILELFEIGALDRQCAEVLAERICEFEEGNSKSDFFISHKKETLDFISKYAGYMKDRCRKDRCNQCVINRWCNHYRINMQKKEESREAPTYADFFCGAGGLSLGFTKMGFKLGLANDIQDCCIETLSFNHPEVPKKHLIAGNINDVLDGIEKNSRYKKVDVVIGGPPCQGFSMANRQRIIDDPRNHLYKSFVKAIESLEPSFFVMENVRGILNVGDQIKEDFKSIGYDVSVMPLNAKDFGIPQNRERVFFIGNKVGIDNGLVFSEIMAEGKKRRRVVLKDALYGLNKLSPRRIAHDSSIENDESGYTISKNSFFKDTKYIRLINSDKKELLVFNHKARYNNDRDIEIFGRLNEGDNSADPKIADIMPYKRRKKIFKDKYYKLESNKPCKTITAHMKYDCNMYIHPHQARGLTPREAARVQSFPDSYYFKGAYTKTYMQVGNSVPPLLSEIIAFVIKKYI